jgi:hypothetical protein
MTNLMLVSLMTNLDQPLQVLFIAQKHHQIPINHPLSLWPFPENILNVPKETPSISRLASVQISEQTKGGRERPKCRLRKFS